MYKLSYLPIARQDMADIVRYISHDLGNPSAAGKLAAELVEVADGIPAFPYSNAAYTPISPLKHEYRKLPVQNFIILYWVDETEKVVTVARIIYARRDYEKLL
jgi:toxin ParE1/3/4